MSGVRLEDREVRVSTGHMGGSTERCSGCQGSPGLHPLPEAPLGAQVHTLGHVFHGPQLQEEAEIQYSQDEQSG